MKKLIFSILIFAMSAGVSYGAGWSDYYSELTAVASGDFLVIQDVSDTTDSAQGTTKYVTQENIIRDGLEGGVEIQKLVLTDSASAIFLEITGTAASDNTFIGLDAGESITTGEDNTFIGNDAGDANTEGGQAVFIGNDAGGANTTGDHNIFIGNQAGAKNTSGHSNVFVGRFAGYENLTNFGNVFLGRDAGRNSTANNNTMIGYYSGDANTSGNSNTFLGSNSGGANTTGANNVFLGSDAGLTNTTADYNTYVGRNAGASATGGSNTYIGYNAAGSGANTGSNNVAVGLNTATAITSGYYNVVMGASAADSLTEGHSNTLIGWSAGGAITTANANVMIGREAGAAEITGGANTLVGHRAGVVLTGDNNTIFGYQAGSSLTTPNANVLIGYQAGDNLTTGSTNIIIGYNIDASAVDASNELNIGNTIYGDLSGGLVQLGTNAGADLLNLTPQSAIDGLYINQANDADSIQVDTDAEANYGLNINTSKYGIRIVQDIDDGRGLYIYKNLGGTDNAASMVRIHNDNAANPTDTLLITQDGTGNAIEVDSESNVSAIMVLAQKGIYVDQDVSSGYAIKATRNINEAGTDPLVSFYNDHTSDTQATLSLQNDGSGPHITTGATNENLEIRPDGTGDMRLYSTDLIIWGDASEAVSLRFYADNLQDNADGWRIQAADGTTLDFNSYGSGSWVQTFTISADYGAYVYGKDNTDPANLHIYADQGTDNNDRWRFVANDGGNFDIESYASGAWVDKMSLSNAGALTVTGTTPILTLVDSDTGADNLISANSGAGSLFISADAYNEVASSIVYIQVDGTSVGTFEASGTLAAGETSLWLYDGSDATLRQVLMGADDSGGAGYKLLRVAN